MSMSRRTKATIAILLACYVGSYYLMSRPYAGQTYERKGVQYFQFFEERTDWEPTFRNVFYPLVKIDQWSGAPVHDMLQYRRDVWPTQEESYIERVHLYNKALAKGKLRDIIRLGVDFAAYLTSAKFLEVLHEHGEPEVVDAFQKEADALKVEINKGKVIVNPLTHFTAAFGQEDQFRRIVHDLNGDGMKDNLFAHRELFDESQEHGQPTKWDVYLRRPIAGHYVQNKEVSNGSPVQLDLAEDQSFVGAIDELGGLSGIVTVRIDNQEGDVPTAFVYAYTVSGAGKITQHELAKYPASDQNEIYDKYLSEDNRSDLVGWYGEKKG